jgi:hypothetical protein
MQQQFSPHVTNSKNQFSTSQSPSGSGPIFDSKPVSKLLSPSRLVRLFETPAATGFGATSQKDDAEFSANAEIAA